MGNKTILTSKTFWLNFLGPIIAYLLAHQDVFTIFHLDAQTVMLIMALLNIINRFFTSKPVI